jgi:hypothetical protein
MGIKLNILGDILLKVPPTSFASVRETILFSFHLTSHILDSVLSKVMLPQGIASSVPILGTA